MKNDCEDCTNASNGLWHGYKFSCMQCRARMVARGMHYIHSQRMGRQSKEYREELQKHGLSHEDVKAAAEIDAGG